MVVLVTLLPTRMKKIQSKIKALEWSQHYSLIFQTIKDSNNSEVSDGILPKFKLIQAFMVGLVTCKNKEDPSVMNALEWSQHFPILSLWGFFQILKGWAANA